MKCPTRKLSDNRNWKLDVTLALLFSHCTRKTILLFSIAADVFYYKLVVHAALEALGSEDATDVAFRLHEILETPLISWQFISKFGEEAPYNLLSLYRLQIVL
uniref:Uncharacterized protein n=1 Tax=Solanum lycopersicum TaxID=4081 RepID=A0A3Q7HRA8_SOLLC